MCVSAVVEGFLIDWRCLIERLFIIGDLRQSSINRLWDVVDNTRRVIRFLVDTERDVIRLVARHVFTIGQVERDIEKVHDFFVSFDRYFKAMPPEEVAQILFDLLCLSGRCSRYSEAVVSVQAKVVAMFHLDAVQEVGTIEATHGYIEKVRPWLTRVVGERLFRMENSVLFLVSDVNVAGSELKCCSEKVN